MPKYIIGFDFGLFKTVACMIPVDNSGDDFHHIKFPSKVYKNMDGVYSLYNRGILFEKMKTTISNLKEAPQVMDAYKAFIHLAVQQTINEFSEAISLGNVGDSNFMLSAAVPSNWSEHDKIEYLRFLNDAIADLGVRFSTIVNEGEAIISSFESAAPNNTVLAIDLASSSIRYSFVSPNSMIQYWINPQLGAGNIEHEILDSYRKHAHENYVESYINTQKLLNENGFNDIIIEDELLKQCRRLKEESYTNGIDSIDLELHFGEFTGMTSIFRRYRFEYNFSLSEVTNEFRSAVKMDFLKVKNEIELRTGLPIENIILTGAAPYMDWVSFWAKKIFSKAEIIDSRNPDCTLARGIAYLSRKNYISSFKHV